MKSDQIKELHQGFETAFVNSHNQSSLAYRPQFVSNNPAEGKKVLSSIEDELLRCDRFSISVAFITMSGITPLLQTLKELEKRGIPGRILTTDYLNFSEPRALEKLASLSNLELKMYVTGGEMDNSGFHTKGYMFKKEEIYRIIVGSSNMTLSALTTNKEWNTKIVSTDQGEYVQEILTEFEGLWQSERTKNFEEFIDYYRTNYEIIKKQRKIAASRPVISMEAYKLKPNSMQIGFINNLRNLLEKGAERALLISATGTGKTYASAFAMRELGFRRVLFLVHRNQIARQALRSFQNVFDKTVPMGLVMGTQDAYDSDYIFATIQTVSKAENLCKFDKKDFDCIILDEAHHSAAGSYKKVLNYFEPRLWLGMTATPDKRDDNLEGRNIYEIFDHNIACEIRLQQAMEEELLCPFHYFGITDLEMVSDDGRYGEKQLENFRYLTSDDRVHYVMEQAGYYGYSGDRVKGLIFCSRVDEARKLSEKFNTRGLRTCVLTGADSPDMRAEKIEQLVQENPDGALDYILSVDIFSEGVDVPEINQVVMLRPTQSPIVFVQQLGRGLRKAADKEYVVILDFIGNYKNNFMIPIALSGDRSYNKDNIRRYVVEGERIIPGASTIHFDEISRKKIFTAVDNANFSDVKLLKENYTNLKNKLGHIPALLDFDRYGEMDVLRIFDNKSLGSYYKFLVKYEKEFTIRLPEDEEKVLEFISRKIANGKRIQELELLKRMMSYRSALMERLGRTLKERYDISLTDEGRQNIVNMMTNEFPSGSAKQTYPQCVFLEKDAAGDYRTSLSFGKMLNHPDFRSLLEELVDFGISRYDRDYRNHYQDTDFVLYQKYTYEDACRLLNWKNNEVPLNIGGYKYDKHTKTFPVFINYDKAPDISDSTKYEDHFTSSRTLVAISKSGRSLQSEDVQNFLKARERGIDVQLFVRKNKDDKISKEFYYLGRMTATGKKKEFTMAGTEKTAVEIEWQLDVPVREDIYQYIVNG